MIKFKRLDHIQLCVPTGKEDEARLFYKNIIGLREIEKPAVLLGNGGFWFKIADIQLHIGTEKKTSVSKAHPAFEVEDIKQVKIYFLEKNVRIKEEIQVEGRERFSILDPFGNRIEFLGKIFCDD